MSPTPSDLKFFARLTQLEELLGPQICSICERNISKSVKVRCLDCPPELNVSLCLECLRTGAVWKSDADTEERIGLVGKAVTHKAMHDYFIFDNLNFPLLTPDWTAWQEVTMI